MTEKTYPAFPLFMPSNRKQKRAMQHEFEKYTLRLGEIEAGFSDMWAKTSFMDYDFLYKKYLDRYIKETESIQSTFHPKFIVMNPIYFQEMYEVEPKQIKPKNLPHDLFEFVRARLWFVE